MVNGIAKRFLCVCIGDHKGSKGKGLLPSLSSLSATEATAAVNESGRRRGNAQHAEDDKDSDDATEFAGGNVQVIKTIEAWEAKLSEAKSLHKIVIANFSATWCGPCKVIAPYYRELSEEYPSLMFLVVDVDELVDVSTSWEIKATPTFFFLRDGQQFDKLVGANKPELAKKIVTIADSVPSQLK